MSAIHVRVVTFLFLFLFFSSVVLTGKEKSIYSKFLQSDYQIKFEWAEVVGYNKLYTQEYHAAAFKFNRSVTAFNLTFMFHLDFGNDLELLIQVYKFSSNEYREFPIHMQLNFCRAIQSNLIGARGAFKCGNFTGCPLKKGVRYEICNFVPDPSHFPPLIPSGRYKMSVDSLYHDQNVATINGYGEIFRPIVKK